MDSFRVTCMGNHEHWHQMPKKTKWKTLNQTFNQFFICSVFYIVYYDMCFSAKWLTKIIAKHKARKYTLIPNLNLSPWRLLSIGKFVEFLMTHRQNYVFAFVVVCGVFMLNCDR